MKPKPYPILVERTYCSKPWGNSGFNGDFPFPADEKSVSEVFLMTPDSVITNGDLAGSTMNDVKALGADFMGRGRVSAQFPIVVKAFATGQPLALQVHPPDAATRQNKELGSNHKAWFVLGAENGTQIYAELKMDFTRQQLLSRLGKDELANLINTFDLEAGDCYYLPSGRVHGIDAGAKILSVEQSSPTTFTVGSGDFHEYDTARPIGQEEAIQYVNFADRTTPRIVRDKTPGASRNRKIPLITTNPVFSIEELRLTAKMHHRTGNNRFHIVIPLDAPIELSSTGHSVEVPKYHACFIPAKTGFYSTIPASEGRILRVC